MTHGFLTREFFARPVLEVARDLVGAILVHDGVAVRLTEVEAYDGPGDPASHAFRGRTARNEVMFGPPGHLYVYRSHGLHWCANVTTGPDGVPSAVLLRAGRVTRGTEIASERRGESVPDVRLARGPGNLGQALGISGALNGADLTAGDALHITEAGPRGRVVFAGPRVGVSSAAEIEWRFWEAADPTVSVYRRSPRAARVGSRDQAQTTGRHQCPSG